MIMSCIIPETLGGRIAAIVAAIVESTRGPGVECGYCATQQDSLEQKEAIPPDIA